jgi:hypothetical protein
MQYARKEYIDKEGRHNYYQIYVGASRIAEYVSELWADRIVEGYNLMADKHNAEVLLKRQLRDNARKNKVITFQRA